MPGPFFPQTDPSQVNLVKEIAELRRQVRLLTSRAEIPDVPKTRRQEITFSHPGDVVAGMSPRYLIKDYAGTLTALTFTAGTPPSGGMNLDVVVNGTTEATVTIPGGSDVYSQDDLLIEVEEWDKVAVNVNTPNGAADTVVHLQLIVSVDSAYD